MTDRSTHAYVTGDNGELAVAKLLMDRGYRVKHAPLEDWDLLIDDFLTIEVKTAHQSGRTDKPNKRWQFCLYAHKDRQKSISEDLLILRCAARSLFLRTCSFYVASLTPLVILSSPCFWFPQGLPKLTSQARTPGPIVGSGLYLGSNGVWWT
jgi:hypothetical protein